MDIIDKTNAGKGVRFESSVRWMTGLLYEGGQIRRKR